MRSSHRLLGILLLLPLATWTATGLVFLLKPGWAAAYEALDAFDGRPVDAKDIIPIADLPLPAAETTGWELRSTALGPVYRVSQRDASFLLHAASGTILSPLDREGVAAIARDAAARAQAPERYGEVSEVSLTPDQGVVRFTGGAEVRVGRNDLSIAQRGSDTAWIDRLYELHYLRWTGIASIDRTLAPIALAAVWLLAFTGLRKLRRRARPTLQRSYPEPRA